MDKKLLDIVKALYCVKWENLPAAAETLLSLEQAVKYTPILIQQRGWRERVTAAKLISSFKLHQFINDLIGTFSISPENYTCSAFVRLINSIEVENPKRLLQKMIDSCSNDEYGDHLKRVIKDSPKY